ncbi:MAG: bifunctional diaminohydroxyphosphoribosylaminopyrimidine deaminase/5-amino-6-(5-phosphoribosylamino)uracil reductase RibD [Enterobacterales bacterium]
MEHDEIYLTRAFKLSQLGKFTTSPNPNVGCVIVNNKTIVGEGYHKFTGQVHAEIYALKMAGNLSKGSTVYVTLEPCTHYGKTAPCVDALINSKISRIVIGMLDPNPNITGTSIDKFKKAGIEVVNNTNLLNLRINKGFFKRMKTGLPLITLKMAISLDGRIAMKSGESKWITSLPSRKDLQIIRATSDAILSTSSTVLRDNPSLSVKWSKLSYEIQNNYSINTLRQPIKVIIDSKNRVNINHKVITNCGRTLLVRLKKDNIIWPKSVEQCIIPKKLDSNKIKRINLTFLMKYLGNKQINTILVEAGASLASALLKEKLIDELIIYQAPKLLGHDAYPLCFLPEINKLNEAYVLSLINIKQIGSDIRLHFKLYK